MEAETICNPSGEKAPARTAHGPGRTGVPYPVSVSNSEPACTSHTFRMPSSLPETSREPSGDKSQHRSPKCPAKEPADASRATSPITSRLSSKPPTIPLAVGGHGAGSKRAFFLSTPGASRQYARGAFLPDLDSIGRAGNESLPVQRKCAVQDFSHFFHPRYLRAFPPFRGVEKLQRPVPRARQGPPPVG